MKNYLWRKNDVKRFGFNELSSGLQNGDIKCFSIFLHTLGFLSIIFSYIYKYD